MDKKIDDKKIDNKEIDNKKIDNKETITNKETKKETVKNILGLPENIPSVGNIYPIKVIDNDEFSDCSLILNVSKDNFQLKDEAKSQLNDIKLLDLLLMGLQDINQTKSMLECLFSLITRKKVFFVSTKSQYAFVIDENNRIDRDNYDLVRDVVMKQNLIFQPKVYKNKLTQEWAEKVLKQKQKNSVKVTIEDIITTVSVGKKVSYNEIMEMTLYQLYADFKRIQKFKDYDSAISLKCAGAEKVDINFYAEYVNMHENPYDNIFVKKDKLNSLNEALS